jgi:imidazolonepropionase-like amidohydrolase
MRLSVFFACALLCVGAGAQKRVDLVVENVTVIDPATRRVLPARSVYIAKARIRAVEPAGEAVHIEARQVIDGRDLFLLPGLLDMHVHLATRGIRGQPGPSLDLLLANGVTGVREMAGDCWEPREEGAVCLKDMRRLARELSKGRRRGPRLLAIASPVVRGVWSRDALPEGAAPFFAPATAEESRELARYLKRRGVDLVKTYHTLEREAYFALAAEAGRLGLEISGHLPLGVSVLEASHAGHRTIEHARDLPLACSRYGAEYRETMHLVVAGEAGPAPPDAEERLRKTFAGFDEDLCDEVLGALAANGTYLVPTHGTRELDARGGEAQYRDDPRLRYVAPGLLERWNEELDATAETAPRFAELYLEFYELGMRLSARAQAAGVGLMVGSDANDTMIVPGFALHDELERLAAAGVAPMEVLRAATTVPAAYLGRGDDLGGVSVGRLADLMLLRADPLADIRNSREIEAVIVGGRVHDRDALTRMLRDVEIAVAKDGSSVAEGGS